jgi:ABC-type polysaccharide/polyol phosphate export permease
MSARAAAHTANARAPRWSWLLFSFTRREVLSRYAGSVTGVAWTLFHPLAQLAIYAVVFTHIFRVGVPEGYPGVTYLAFVAVALWPWIMFSEGVQRAMGSIASNGGLIRKVAFPHRLLVYASVLACCVIHGLGFVAVLAVLSAIGEPLHLWRMPLVVILLVPYMLLATGVGAALAALHILLRDVEHVLQVVLMMVFYASPILYPVSMVPAALRPLVEGNPLGWFSERMRQILFLGSGLVPGDALAAIACVAVFFAGLWFFQRLSPHFEDFL